MNIVSPNASLEDKIAAIEGRQFETELGGKPNLSSYLNGLHLIRLAGLAKHWHASDQDFGAHFEQLVEDVVFGLYGLATSFTFLIHSDDTNIKVIYGVPDDVLHAPSSLTSLFQGSFPEAKLKILSKQDNLVNSISNMQFCGVMSGVPSDKAEKKTHMVERLIRGLQGEPWTLAISASPINRNQITKIFDSIAHEIYNTQNSHLLKGTLDEGNRLAKYYIELLEAALNQYRQGKNVGMWQTLVYLSTTKSATLNRGLSLLSSIYSGENSIPQSVRVNVCDQNANQSLLDSSPPNILSSRELAIIVRPPKEECPGFNINDYARFDIALPDTIEDGEDGEQLAVGPLVNDGIVSKNWISVGRNDMTKHGLIVGTTGGGKTNTCMFLLDQLWHEHHIPFLVIEPAKSEYRNLAMVDHFNDLQIFTLGDETTAPFRLNPFMAPPGIHIQTHIDNLKSLFNASFVLYAPMPYILEQSIHEIYEERGWDLAANSNLRGQNVKAYPTISDLYQKIPEVVDRMGYDRRISMDVKAGLQARIRNLRIGGKGIMLDTRKSVSLMQILERPTILELKNIGDDEEKAFLIGLLLLQLYEYYEGRVRLGTIELSSALNHVTLVEEAHRLLQNTSASSGNEESANPKAKAVEAFCQMLAELRSYGECMLIAEQIPLKLAPDIIKNTNLKILHRIVSAEDREAMGNSMNMNTDQKRIVTSLCAGRAAVYAEGMDKPYLVQIPNYKHNFLKKKQRSDSDIHDLMKERYHSACANIFMPFDNCNRCQKYVRHPGAMTTARSIYEQKVFQNQFISFFLNVVINSNSAYLSFVKLRQTIISGFHQLEEETTTAIIYCILLMAAERTLDSRGKLFSWKFQDQAMIERLLHDLIVALIRVEQETNEDTFHDQIDKPLELFKNEYIKLCSSSKGPFSACTLCKAKCNYRYDVAQAIIHNSWNTQFKNAFVGNSLDAMFMGGANYCLHKSNSLITDDNNEHLRPIALCCGIQLASLECLSDINLTKFAHKILSIPLDKTNKSTSK